MPRRRDIIRCVHFLAYLGVKLVAQRTRDYELMMVLSPEATEEEVSATVEWVRGLLSKGGGSMGEHKVLGVRRLAYPIKNFNEGNYVLTQFALYSSEVEVVNRTLNASEDILRFLVTNL